MNQLSGREYIENELKLFGPIKNRIYSILGKGPLYSEVLSEISFRRGTVISLLEKGN